MVLESSRRWRENNPEKVRNKSRRYYAKNLEKEQARAREYAAAHPEEHRISSRRYRAAHPEQTRILTARRRARKLGLPDTFTVEQRQFMLQYWGFSCAVCNNQEGFEWKLVDDHFLPISQPGCPGTVAENIIPLCHGLGGCNNSKGKRLPHAWLIQRLGKKKATIVENKIFTYFERVRLRTCV